MLILSASAGSSSSSPEVLRFSSPKSAGVSVTTKCYGCRLADQRLVKELAAHLHSALTSASPSSHPTSQQHPPPPPSLPQPLHAWCLHLKFLQQAALHPSTIAEALHEHSTPLPAQHIGLQSHPQQNGVLTGLTTSALPAMLQREGSSVLSPDALQLAYGMFVKHAWAAGEDAWGTAVAAAAERAASEVSLTRGKQDAIHSKWLSSYAACCISASCRIILSSSSHQFRAAAFRSHSSEHPAASNVS